MKRFHSAFCWSLAIVLGAIALPAIAAKPPQQGQDKSYGVEFLLPAVKLGPDGNPVLDSNGNQIKNPAYDSGGVTDDFLIHPPVTVVVYIKNENPPSTAASNISSLQFDLSPSLVLVNDPNAIGCPRAHCAVSGNTIFVSNISPPIQGKEIYPITLQVNTCVVANEAFIGTPTVYSGASFSGNTFNQFTTDKTFKPAQTLSTRGDKTVFPVNFTTEDTPAVTGISCGNITCLQQFSIGNDDPNTGAYKVVSGLRGLDADGTCSIDNLQYFVTNKLNVTTLTDPVNRSVHFVWPTDATSDAVFAYKLTRSDSGTEWDLGWLPKPPDLPVTLNADTLHCNGFITGDEPAPTAVPLPKAYGVLAQAVKVNTKQLKVTVGNNGVPNAGDPIIIESERMVVTSIDSNGWSVTRTDPQPHDALKTVASTPMPLLASDVANPPYTPNAPAKMCLAWTNGTSAWIIDAGDAWGLSR